MSDHVFELQESLIVKAPIDRCFLLSTCVEIVHKDLGMYAVAGRSHGLAVEGDVIRWEGWQLGMKHHHVSQIANYQFPIVFQDRMLDGRFAMFEHDHNLRTCVGGTMLSDQLRFALPYGWLGRVVGRWIMVPHITKLMKKRFEILKRIAESDNEWKKYASAEQQSLTGQTQ